MKTEIKQKWCEALRSGEYKQADGALRTIDRGGDPTGYCCLGVLCDLHAKETGSHWEGIKYFDSDAFLSDVVMEWADLYDAEVDTGEEGYDIDASDERLSELNDAGHPFSEIADLIENNL